MKILLTVPIYLEQFNWNKWYSEVSNYIKSRKVDLIVFPEGFIRLEDGEKRNEVVREFALDFSVPVLMGVEMYDGSQWAVYFNPNPGKGETVYKEYCKHSTAPVTAFDLIDYDERVNTFFKPVLLNGYRIQFNICHDIFFPLITEKLERNGIDILINLTGGNVNLHKWHDVFQGRSFETSVPIFCTMGYNPEVTGKAETFFFLKGKKIEPVHIRGNLQKKCPVLALYDLKNSEADLVYKQEISYSEKKYTDFQISFKLYKKADLCLEITPDGLSYLFDKEEKLKDNNSFYLFPTDKGNILVNFLPYKELTSRIALYNLVVPSHAHHFINIYYSLNEVPKKEALALLKLRAIESRVGCVLISPNLKVGLKTNRYKNIQMFLPYNDIIGFNLEFIGGIDSLFNKGNLGINIKYAQKYKYMLR